MTKSSDTIILEASIKALTKALNDLLTACAGYNEGGKPELKAPEFGDFMKACGCLPKGYSMSLVK